jgi:hypothetical protein
MVLSRWQPLRLRLRQLRRPPCRSRLTAARQGKRFSANWNAKDRFPKVETLCQRLMGAIADVIPVLPVSLVSAVFLEAPGTDLDILED